MPEPSDTASGNRPQPSVAAGQSLIDAVRDPSSAVINALTEQIEALEAEGKQEEADRLRARRALLEANLRPGGPRIPRSTSLPTPGGSSPPPPDVRPDP